VSSLCHTVTVVPNRLLKQQGLKHIAALSRTVDKEA
jgi:hypothetical protein